MAESLGNTAVIQASIDGGSTYTAIGEVKDSNFDQSQDNHDATSNDNGLYKVEVAGHKQGTLTFTVNYDESDAGQNNLRTAYYAGTTVMFKYRPRGTLAGYKEALFSANPTAMPIACPTQGVKETAASYTTTGTITWADQT